MKHPYFENTQNKLFINHCNCAYAFPSHFHSFIEIAYCFRGAQSIKINEHIYTLSAGDAALIFPYTEHEYLDASDCKDQTESLSIMCDVTSLSGDFPVFAKHHSENPIIPEKHISSDAKLAFLKILENEDVLTRLGFTYIICANLLNFLNVTANSGTDDYKLAIRLTTYIDENFCENLTLPVLAAKFGYSASYIAHVFCDQLKIPFRSYLNSVRCEYAATQISTTTKCITTIAYESGFNSINTFCRSFKKYYNLTPSQYKNRTIS